MERFPLRPRTPLVGRRLREARGEEKKDPTKSSSDTDSEKGQVNKARMVSSGEKGSGVYD